MINKIFKLIHNKFSRFFKFVFFLRYLFSIFFVAIVLFLFIPQFFDYKNREEIIKLFLSQTYNLNIDRIEEIRFYSFPVPHLEINNILGSFYLEDIKIKTNKLRIYPKLLSIYNYNNFQARKIKIENSDIELDLKNISFLFKNIYTLQNKLILKDLNLRVMDSNKKVIDLKKIRFFNYGYKKKDINGQVFKKNFKIKLKDDLKNINFKLLNTGINFQLNFIDENQNLYKGNLKGKILKSNYKLDFILDESLLEIENFFFRNQDISFDSLGYIDLKPFFKINLNSKIKNFNPNILSNLDIMDILKFKDFIKRFNSQNNITFQSKKFQRNLIDDLDIKINLQYGRLNVSKNLKISDSNLICQNNINLLDEYPLLYFDCLIKSPDKKILFKKFNVKIKTNKEPLDLSVVGNINILNSKINFNEIEMDGNYKASKEDLEYFKSKFEKILFDNGFINLFVLSKIEKFIEEIN